MGRTTKAQRERIEAEKRERIERDTAALAAFSWTGPVEPDLPVPETFGQPNFGWTFNAHAKRVEEAWSESNSHGSGGREQHANKRVWGAAQNGIPLYSTKRLALQAMRHAVCMLAGHDLARIDKALKDEGGA